MIYEILYIIPSRFSETEIDGVVKQVEEVLQKHEAKLEKTENLGKIKLAYPIKKERYGTYILAYATMEPDAILKIDTDLRLKDEVLRHILVKREDGIPTVPFKMVGYEAPITAEGKRIHKKMVVEAPKRPAPVPPGEKLSMDDIDKKVDSILKDENLGDV